MWRFLFSFRSGLIEWLEIVVSGHFSFGCGKLVGFRDDVEENDVVGI